jgi:hypothetical protein
VTPPPLLQTLALPAAGELDSTGGPGGLVSRLSDQGTALGDLTDTVRAGLLISLDEMAETEALEAQWREAEEMAALVDGELTQVPGFEEFRHRILASES